MKTLICFLALVACLITASCSRNNDNNRVQSDPEISFDANGVHYVYSGQATTSSSAGVFAWKDFIPDPSTPRTKYEFAGNKDLNNDINILAYPDSLKTQTYTSVRVGGSIINTAGITLEVNGESYTTKGAANDYFELKITDYKNGVVSGTFFANASSDRNPALNIPPIVITNGVLKNVRLQYW